MARVLFLLLSLAGSLHGAGTSNAPAVTAPPTPSNQIFQVQGVIVGLEPDGKTARIRHEAIPGYMGAMTMPLEVKDTNELAGLKAGDAVRFRMIVTTNDGWIDQVVKQDAPSLNLPLNVQVHLSPDVEPLKEGDLLPDFTLTNELGKRIHLSQYRGGPLALTFLFTRCPFPTYCPLMANNFAEVQRKLLAATNAPAQWHLLTVSFDPEFDKPEVLLGYAKSHGYDPRHSSFATGSLTDVTALGDLFELQFWKEPEGIISHNLRTAVIDPAGRVRKILVGNQWTSDELVREMFKAVEAKLDAGS